MKECPRDQPYYLQLKIPMCLADAQNKVRSVRREYE